MDCKDGSGACQLLRHTAHITLSHLTPSGGTGLDRADSAWNLDRQSCTLETQRHDHIYQPLAWISGTASAHPPTPRITIHGIADDFGRGRVEDSTSLCLTAINTLPVSRKALPTGGCKDHA